MRRGYVYFLRIEYGECPVKIGHTRHPMSRLQGLQPWCPWPLILVAVFECAEPEKEERRIHRRLAHIRLRNEWFAGGAAVENEIASLSARLKRVEVVAKDLREPLVQTVMVRFRTTPADAKRCRMHARSRRQSLSAWIRDSLNRVGERSNSREGK